MDSVNPFEAVKVLPLPECQPKSGKMRSWGAIDKLPVNSASGQNERSGTSRKIPHTGRYFLGIDWFEATLMGKFVTIDPDDIERPLVNSAFESPKGQRPGQVLLYHNQASRRNRHYRFGFDVLFVPAGSKVSENREAMLSSYKIGVISAVPHLGNNCKPGSSIFQAENNILYRSDLWPTLDATFAALESNVSHLTRLDIALDGFGLMDAPSAYYRDKMEVMYGRKKERQYDVIGRADYDQCKNGRSPRNWQTGEDGNLSIFYVGGISSKKSLNGYAKGQRIDIENKQYIREAWKMSGLISDDAEGEDVTRLEIRNRKEALDELNLLDVDSGELQRFDWTRLRDARYLAGMYKETLRNFYGFKIVNPNDKDKSRWEDVPTVDWEAFDTAKVIRISRTRSSSETWKAKHAALKIIRDDAANDYLAAAVRTEIENAPSFQACETTVKQIVKEITTAAPGVTPETVRRVVATIADKLAKDAVEYVTAWSVESIPAAIGWALAEEHDVTGYIEYRLRQDVQAGNGENILFMNPRPVVVAA